MTIAPFLNRDVYKIIYHQITLLCQHDVVSADDNDDDEYSLIRKSFLFDSPS